MQVSINCAQVLGLIWLLLTSEGPSHLTGGSLIDCDDSEGPVSGVNSALASLALMRILLYHRCSGSTAVAPPPVSPIADNEKIVRSIPGGGEGGGGCGCPDQVHNGADHSSPSEGCCPTLKNRGVLSSELIFTSVVFGRQNSNLVSYLLC
jgi:hypothetical protein